MQPAPMSERQAESRSEFGSPSVFYQIHESLDGLVSEIQSSQRITGRFVDLRSAIVGGGKSRPEFVLLLLFNQNFKQLDSAPDISLGLREQTKLQLIQSKVGLGPP